VQEDGAGTVRFFPGVPRQKGSGVSESETTCPDCEGGGIERDGTVFDVLAYRGRSLLAEPYRKRRKILERIDFGGRAHVPEAFGDGPALFDAVCEQELEGIVAKRLNERSPPGERAWVKTKNRSYWRYEIERESRAERERSRRFHLTRRRCVTCGSSGATRGTAPRI
jgi:hypothetical protein